MDADEFDDRLVRLGITDADLARLLSSLGDPRDQANMARQFRRFRAGDSRISGEMTALLTLLERQMIAPPPDTLRPDDDRDAPAGEALDPHLDLLLARATAAGWTEPEIVVATLTWCLHRSLDGAGADRIADDLEAVVARWLRGRA